MLNKVKTIKFRVTEVEHSKIKFSAEKCGFSVSKYCLSIALKHNPQAVQSEDFNELLDELRSFYDCVKDNEEYRKRYEELFLRFRSKAVK